MQAVLSTLLTTCCGSVMTLLMFAITVMIQNSERIGKHITNMWISFWKFNVTLYKSIIQGISNLLKIKSPEGVPRVLITTAVSEAFTLGLLLLLDIPITIWVLVVALIHGIAIFLKWDKYEDSPGLDIGRRLE